MLTGVAGPCSSPSSSSLMVCLSISWREISCAHGSEVKYSSILVFVWKVRKDGLRCIAVLDFVINILVRIQDPDVDTRNDRLFVLC